MGFLKVLVSASDENLRMQNLCIMRAAFFEFHFPFQIDISCQQEILVDIVVQSFDRDPQFRMVCQDHVRGLPLLDQRFDNAV